MARGNNTGKHWKKNAWVVKRAKEGMGDITDHNIQVAKLPPVGTYVYLRERYDYKRGYGEDNTVLASYKLMDRELDGWDMPIVFKIVGYTYSNSDEDVMRRDNYVFFEGKRNGSSYIHKTSLDTFRIAIGVYKLEERPDDKQIYRSIRCSADDSPVARYTSMCIQKMKERGEWDE